METEVAWFYLGGGGFGGGGLGGGGLGMQKHNASDRPEKTALSLCTHVALYRYTRNWAEVDFRGRHMRNAADAWSPSELLGLHDKPDLWWLRAMRAGVGCVQTLEEESLEVQGSEEAVKEVVVGCVTAATRFVREA